MIISNFIFNRMKELQITNGVFLLVSNNKEQLRDEAPAFAHSLLNYSKQDIILNEKIYITDGDYISVDTVNDFLSFEIKKAVNVSSKILIMHDIELLKDNVSDKMLKSIEDYHNDSLIILTTTSLESVSRTIKSRCMIFKEYSQVENYFIKWKNKYLNFIEKVDLGDFTQIPTIIEEMQNLGSLNIIQAMFINLSTLEELTIARNALDCLLTGSKDNQVNTYLVNSMWCQRKNLRRFLNVNSTSR